jgi:uncharacterized protein YjbJ (UPF0337 family)
MGILDKAKHEFEKAKGGLKEEAGKRNNDPDLVAEGKKDQASGELKNAGEKVKDAAGDVKDAISH